MREFGNRVYPRKNLKLEKALDIVSILRPDPENLKFIAIKSSNRALANAAADILTSIFTFYWYGYSYKAFWIL